MSLRRRLILWSLIAALAVAQRAMAAESVHLEVHPAALPSPAMKYRLMPPAAEQTPGNAATLYLSAFAAAGRITTDDAFARLKSAALNDLVSAGAPGFLAKYAGVIQQLELAGDRDHCEWDPPTHEQRFNADFSYLSGARVMVDLLRIKTRLEIAQHRYDQAIKTLQAAFALAHNLNQPPVLQAVVATDLEAELLEDVGELICQPGCPNLYWALANLPSADEQRRRVIEGESLFFLFPQLRHPENLSARESRELLNTLAGIVNVDERAEWNASLMLTLIRVYPQARDYLIHTGLQPATVESMPANSAVLSYFVADYRRRADELEKWAGLPLWQACAGTEHATRELDNEGPSANPLLSILPRHNELLQFALVERKRAMLEVVEAIRNFAQAHEGACPQSLTALSQTPVPPDPVLNRQFDYTVNGSTATLHAAAPSNGGQPPESTYLIAIVP